MKGYYDDIRKEIRLTPKERILIEAMREQNHSPEHVANSIALSWGTKEDAKEPTSYSSDMCLFWTRVYCRMTKE